MRHFILLLTTFSLAFALSLGQIQAVERTDLDKLISQGEAYLWAQHQADNSFWAMKQFKLGISAVVIDALVDQNPEALKDPRIQQSIAWIKSFQQEDGGIYNPDEGLGNYVTSLSLMLLARIGEADKAYIERAQNYLLGLQNTDENSIHHGGIGYGSKGPGHEDLNNTTYAITALRESGLPADHPSMKAALEFIERCQNLSAHNEMEWAGNDGGAVYSPDVSKAGGSWGSAADQAAGQKQAESGRLLSYGSMTYNLITSYIYLNLKMGDERLDAALRWVSENYVFDRNPGMPAGQERQGQYYYLGMMAKTLATLELDVLKLPNGNEVDWRDDFYQHTLKTAKWAGENNSQAWWVNEADRWAEGVPVLITAYIVKSLKYIRSTMK